MPSGSGIGGTNGANVSIPTNADPFTGSAAASSGLLPLKGYTLFSAQLASDSVLSKLKELNPADPEAHLASVEEWNHVR